MSTGGEFDYMNDGILASSKINIKDNTEGGNMFGKFVSTNLFFDNKANIQVIGNDSYNNNNKIGTKNFDNGNDYDDNGNNIADMMRHRMTNKRYNDYVSSTSLTSKITNLRLYNYSNSISNNHNNINEKDKEKEIRNSFTNSSFNSSIGDFNILRSLAKSTTFNNNGTNTLANGLTSLFNINKLLNLNNSNNSNNSQNSNNSANNKEDNNINNIIDYNNQNAYLSVLSSYNSNIANNRSNNFNNKSNNSNNLKLKKQFSIIQEENRMSASFETNNNNLNLEDINFSKKQSYNNSRISGTSVKTLKTSRTNKNKESMNSETNVIYLSHNKNIIDSNHNNNHDSNYNINNQFKAIPDNNLNSLSQSKPIFKYSYNNIISNNKILTKSNVTNNYTNKSISNVGNKKSMNNSHSKTNKLYKKILIRYKEEQANTNNIINNKTDKTDKTNKTDNKTSSNDTKSSINNYNRKNLNLVLNKLDDNDVNEDDKWNDLSQDRIILNHVNTPCNDIHELFDIHDIHSGSSYNNNNNNISSSQELENQVKLLTFKTKSLSNLHSNTKINTNKNNANNTLNRIINKTNYSESRDVFKDKKINDTNKVKSNDNNNKEQLNTKTNKDDIINDNNNDKKSNSNYYNNKTNTDNSLSDSEEQSETSMSNSVLNLLQNYNKDLQKLQQKQENEQDLISISDSNMTLSYSKSISSLPTIANFKSHVFRGMFRFNIYEYYLNSLETNISKMKKSKQCNYSKLNRSKCVSKEISNNSNENNNDIDNDKHMIKFDDSEIIDESEFLKDFNYGYNSA